MCSGLILITYNILITFFCIKAKYNLVSETLLLLDVICGSTTGGLGLLGLYINENNVMLINQILETLTEYCQVIFMLFFLL